MPRPDYEDPERAIWLALDRVVDPCSRFNGSVLSLVALGMIDAVAVDDDGVAHIQLLLDDPTCLYLAEIDKDVREAVLAVGGVKSVSLQLTADRLWGAERMTQAARDKVAEGRTRSTKHLIPTDALRRPSAAPDSGP